MRGARAGRPRMMHGVAPFREVDAARVRYLNRDECQRLVNASPEALRMIVRDALLSGARYSELARMHVADFHRDSGTLLVRTSKAGRVRHIELTGEGLEFFQRDHLRSRCRRNPIPARRSRLGQVASAVPACRSLPSRQGQSGHLVSHATAHLCVADGHGRGAADGLGSEPRPQRHREWSKSTTATSRQATCAKPSVPQSRSGSAIWPRSFRWRAPGSPRSDVRASPATVCCRHTRKGVHRGLTNRVDKLRER
jgi:hypothetical protein